MRIAFITSQNFVTYTALCFQREVTVPKPNRNQPKPNRENADIT
jgi:hypothetical protein